MLERGIIEPSSSSKASPVVLITKKDVNPRVDDCIDALSGSKYFSSLDLNSGYWQSRNTTSDDADDHFPFVAATVIDPSTTLPDSSTARSVTRSKFTSDSIPKPTMTTDWTSSQCRRQIVVPDSQRSEVFRYFHDIPSAGHLGADKMLSKSDWDLRRHIRAHHAHEHDHTLKKFPRLLSSENSFYFSTNPKVHLLTNPVPIPSLPEAIEARRLVTKWAAGCVPGITRWIDGSNSLSSTSSMATSSTKNQDLFLKSVTWIALDAPS
ncbi:hypothetical protein DPMN_039334 [Dreissena polymorpha]|uniref:Integrase zinc-binding domain-containing protein n=1 Tax=Dreissena polymorpha TaxID=45954 RepID=A0A9D4MHZ7_DREPO|nr:hypothetical protein DPMN_039334 [Dreissena polymorpha]